MLLPYQTRIEIADTVLGTLEALPEQNQQQFIDEYERKKRTLGLAFLLWFLGFHYAYLKKWTLLIVFWISCFLILGLIWWIVDAFRIKNLVSAYNKDLSNTIMNAVISQL